VTMKQLRRLFRRRFLGRRMRDFVGAIGPRGTILDVGGTSYAWRLIGYSGPVTILNLSVPEETTTGFEYVEGDGTRLAYSDRHFDTIFSNSVIEHLSTWEQQCRFASELRRVGQRLWVQTPARAFPIEPHYFAPFIHWLPAAWRRRVARWTPWGIMQRPTPERIAEMVAEIRLLGRREMKRLFPDCEIRTERFLGLPKSYIAVRRETSG